MNNTQRIWFTIHSTSGLGPAAAQKLAVRLDADRRSVSDLAALDGDGIATATGLSESLSFALAHGLGNLDRLLVDDEYLLLPGDAHYPNSRFLSANPPLPVALWAYGRTSLLDDGSPALAVAGSRHADEDLLTLTHSIGGVAVNNGWTVVSGLAAGVDSAAHQGALDAGGSTIGVLASGIAARGRNWQPESLDDACIVSQFSPAEPWSGPRAMQRNSTIAALSDRVLIIAAGDSGGSWEMGQLCLKRRKDLYVLDLDETVAAGNQKLIRAGAVPVDPHNVDTAFNPPTAPPPSAPTLFD